MSNSSLVNYTRLSPNHSGKRTHSIDRISPHCVVGQSSIESLGALFANPARGASCNYGIGYDGRVGMYVEEKNRSWCTSSNANDQRAVTIECASDITHPYAMNSAVYNKLIDLCVDICKRNGKKKLLWFSNPTTALNYAPKSDEMVLTVHRWFANKACPGDWLFSRLGNVASEVTKRLGGSSTSASTGTQNGKYESYSGYVEVIYNGLSIRSKASWDSSAVCGTVKKGEVFTIVGRQLVGGVYLYKLKSGKWITSAKEYVKYRTTIYSAPDQILTVGSVVTSVPMQIAAPSGAKTAIKTINGDECVYIPALGGYFPTKFVSEADASDGKKDGYLANTKAKVTVDQCTVEKVDVSKNLVMIHGIWVKPAPLTELKNGK